MCLVSLDSTETIQQNYYFMSFVTLSRPSNLAMTYIKIRGILYSFVRQIPLMLILFPNVDMIGYNMPSFDQSS